MADEETDNVETVTEEEPPSADEQPPPAEEQPPPAAEAPAGAASSASPTPKQSAKGPPAEGATAQPPPQPAPAPPQRTAQDPLNTEFLYYSAVLRILGPTLTHEADRRVVIPWVRKLFRPEYHSTRLREKRNRYLAYLSTSLLLDEAIGIFRTFPPEGALPNCYEIPSCQVQAAEWEYDKAWQETLAGLPDDFQMLECCVHASVAECKNDHKLDKILDQEFQLFLYIARPYAYLIRNGNDRTRIAAWLQMLCSIHGKDSCSSMKAMRNDYMMALLGYLQDLRAVGPFADLPSWKTLVPLAEAAKTAAENKPIIDPTGAEANEFLLNQPVPEDGAFCYIALTGDLISSNLIS
ncbi:uncharacterized protein [Leptinotarsa decemlineata]|uniref:uncharacterized protein n=1 Tax=Leptinotarsa decemlineata TaxID=7539 RepID=UPI000C251D19|nr:uncharacterized protein LOC111510361 [Leptinotarsa decemlineata]